MKYLLIQKRAWSVGYELAEFESAEALTAHLLSTDALAKDVIVAQRLGIQMQLCEYVPPAPEPEEAAAAEEEREAA
jgi:hypothetical protein